MFDIKKLDQKNHDLIQNIINQKTKPPGALGQLETLAMQLALTIGTTDPKDTNTITIPINKPTMLVFAGDHGIAEEGVSIAPSEVTQQMVLNFLNGGAAINCFCRANKMSIKVIDAGILLPITDDRLVSQPLGRGTENFSKQAAMPISVVENGLILGAKVAYRTCEQGSNVLGFGEMGIANTSSATAIMSALLDESVEDCVGRGTGIDDQAMEKKISLIKTAMKLHKDNLDTPLAILSSVGGFEIVQMVGAMLAAAEKQCVLLIDGFIATAAALVASRINAHVVDYMVFCHQSNEQGHQLMLRSLDANPLLSLDLRLGEGTGAALGMSLVQASAIFFNEMASFESAGVEAV